MEFVILAGLAAGSIAAPPLLRAFGVRGTLILLGGGLAGLTLAHAVRFARLDQAMPAPGPEVGLLRNLAMFAPLPLAVTELLTAEQPLGTLALGRAEFLTAVRASSASKAAADALAGGARVAK